MFHAKTIIQVANSPRTSTPYPADFTKRIFLEPNKTATPLPYFEKDFPLILGHRRQVSLWFATGLFLTPAC
jgi:hypothetical protein